MVDSLIQEVDEAVRADEWRALWQRFSKVITWVTGSVIIFTIGYVWYQDSKISYQETMTLSLLEAHMNAREGDFSKATSVIEAAPVDEPPIGISEASLRLLTLLEQYVLVPESAGLLTDESRQTITAHPNVNAALKALWNMVLATNGETVDSDVFSAEQVTLEQTPFAGLLLELQALGHMERGEFTQARDVLATLSADPLMSKTQRERAQALMHQIPAVDSEAPAADTQGESAE